MKLPQAQIKDIILQEVENELLIYNLTTNKAYSLNSTAKLVYQSCDSKTSIAELAKRHNLNNDLIFLTLDELKKEDLLDDNSSYKSPFAGLSRREVVKKVGFTTLVALPIIASVVAPSAIMAQSGLSSLRGSCTTSANCASSAPNCTTTPNPGGQMICCVGSDSRYDTGGVVNSCSSGPGGGCSAATFMCQSDANQFCCSGSATAICDPPNSCACRCN